MTAVDLPTSNLQQFFTDIDQCVDKSEVTHGLHPYPAKFIPHIPRQLIREYAPAGATVLDPMCGSGTTLVEANLLGHPAVGCDLNPIATLAAAAKTTALSRADVEVLHELSDQLDAGAHDALVPDSVPSFLNRDKWFQPHVSTELAVARQLVAGLPSSARLLAMGSLSAIIVAVSNQESETRWCAKHNDVPPGTTLRKFARKLRRVVEQSANFNRQATENSLVLRCDSRHLPLATGSVGFVVTSPPYANSHDYYLYNKLRMFWLGFDVKGVQEAEIGSRNRHSDRRADIDHYLTSMADVLRECRRVLMPGSAAAVVVADSVIRGEFFDMGVEFPNIARAAGFEIAERFGFSHRTHNTTFQSGFGTAVPKRTHVLVFR